MSECCRLALIYPTKRHCSARAAQGPMGKPKSRAKKPKLARITRFYAELASQPSRLWQCRFCQKKKKMKFDLYSGRSIFEDGLFLSFVITIRFAAQLKSQKLKYFILKLTVRLCIVEMYIKREFGILFITCRNLLPERGMGKFIFSVIGIIQKQINIRKNMPRWGH